MMRVIADVLKRVQEGNKKVESKVMANIHDVLQRFDDSNDTLKDFICN